MTDLRAAAERIVELTQDEHWKFRSSPEALDACVDWAPAIARAYLELDDENERLQRELDGSYQTRVSALKRGDELFDECEKLRAVVGAARLWRAADLDQNTPLGGRLLDALADEVDALEGKAKP